MACCSEVALSYDFVKSFCDQSSRMKAIRGAGNPRSSRARRRNRGPKSSPFPYRPWPANVLSVLNVVARDQNLSICGYNFTRNWRRLTKYFLSLPSQETPKEQTKMATKTIQSLSLRLAPQKFGILVQRTDQPNPGAKHVPQQNRGFDLRS
jgi:hypothetical protein